MNIRPLDLQVLIPRTLDVAKMASVSEQQSATQQQQVSSRLKQVVAEQQHQVQTALSSQHDGKVDLEDLDQEKRKRRRQQEKDKNRERMEAESAAGPNQNLRLPEFQLGHTIDIKT